MPRPFCRANFATLRDTPELVSARVIRSWFSHEIMILRFRDRNLSAKNYRSGTPIEVQWGVFPRYREEFVGYVHHVKDEARVEPGALHIPVVEVVAVGATRVLRDERPKNWGDIRLDMAAAQMARTARLQIDADPTERIHEPLMQPAESQWAFLASSSSKEGYMLSAQGTRVLLWNLERRLPKMIPYAPLFRRDRGEVHDFQPLSGESNPSDNEAADRAAFSMSLHGGGQGRFSGRASGGATSSLRATQSLSAQLDPDSQFYATTTGEVLGSSFDVRQELSTVRRRTERVYHAKATLAPFPPLRPGDPVVLTGYGERQSGVWVTDDVVFRLDGEKIAMQVELSRAEARDNGQRPRVPYGKSPYRRRAESRLVDNRWVARGQV